MGSSRTLCCLARGALTPRAFNILQRKTPTGKDSLGNDSTAIVGIMRARRDGPRMDNKSTLCSDAESFAPLLRRCRRGGQRFNPRRLLHQHTSPIALPKYSARLQAGAAAFPTGEAAVFPRVRQRHGGLAAHRAFQRGEHKRIRPRSGICRGPGTHTQMTNVFDYGTSEAASGEIASPAYPIGTTNERLSTGMIMPHKAGQSPIQTETPQRI